MAAGRLTVVYRSVRKARLWAVAFAVLWLGTAGWHGWTLYRNAEFPCTIRMDIQTQDGTVRIHMLTPNGKAVDAEFPRACRIAAGEIGA